MQKPWLSKSSIQLYETCPYAFYLRFVEELEPPSTPAQMQRGSRFHKWANTIYDKTNKKAILSGDVTVYSEIKKYIDSDDIVYENFARMEQERWKNDPTEDFFPIRTEEFLEDEELLYFGTYDRLDKDKDHYVVSDYKTGGFREWKLSDYRFELFGYKHLIEKNYDKYNVEKYCVIFPDSKRYYYDKFSKLTKNAFYNKVKRIRLKIKNRKFPKKGQCAFCFMSEVCAYNSEQIK